MATTVPGGRYLSADQKFWLDCEGKVIGENKPEAEAPVQPEPVSEPEPEAAAEEQPAKKAKGK